MNDEVKSCGCWQAPAGTGETCAATWLNRHDRVAVTAHDGRSVEGRPDGSVWFRSGGEWEAGFQVTRDDGAGCCVPLAAIEKITLRRAIDPTHLVDALVHALVDRGSDAMGTPGKVGADAQEGYHLEITVAVIQTPVAAPPD